MVDARIVRRAGNISANQPLVDLVTQKVFTDLRSTRERGLHIPSLGWII